jgi:predicted DNA-binding protein (MmcQ/YjbR family)
MNYTAVRRYVLRKPEAYEDFPFGPGAAVFKVSDKMFALLARRDGVARVNLKCDPEEAIVLRDLFDAVIPGYHMNKAHWNTVILDGSVPRGEIQRMIDCSYALVVRSLRKPERTALEIRHGTETLYGGCTFTIRAPLPSARALTETR